MLMEIQVSADTINYFFLKSCYLLRHGVDEASTRYQTSYSYPSYRRLDRLTGSVIASKIRLTFLSLANLA